MPSKRPLVLTGLAVVAVGLVAMSAVGGGDDDSPELAPVPDHPPADAPATPPSSETVESSQPSTSETSLTSVSTSTTTTTIDPAFVARSFPVDPAVSSSFTPEAHANYRATDIFASSGCGTALVAPVTGSVDEVMTNTWDPNIGDPATRGGNAVSIIGDDGVRYYLAHFQRIDPAITPGVRVVAGDYLGEMGDTGRAGACHVHFGLSLPCATEEWWVRRGVIWPETYLAAWQQGENMSPLPELEAWFAEYPQACNSVEDTPYPVG